MKHGRVSAASFIEEVGIGHSSDASPSPHSAFPLGEVLLLTPTSKHKHNILLFSFGL